MDKSKWGVHETHCCVAHGCKYGDPDCPVVNKQTKQQYLCEYCHEDGIETIEEAMFKSNGMAKLNPNQMYAQMEDKLVAINGYKFSGEMITLFLLNGKEETLSTSKITLLQKERQSVIE